MRLKPLGAATACLLLAGCVYASDRQWMPLRPQEVPLNQAAAWNTEKQGRLPGELRACVAAEDPGQLPDLDAGRGYTLSGWFISEDRVKRVRTCMGGKGWDTVVRPWFP